MSRRVLSAMAVFAAAGFAAACSGGSTQTSAPTPAALSTPAATVVPPATPAASKPAPSTAPQSAAASIAASAPPSAGAPSAAASTEASVAPRSTAPASFALTVAGDPNVQGTWSDSFGVDCNNPGFNGSDILFFAKSPDGKAVVLVTVQPSSIQVSERAGAGAAYTDREFQGTGVASLDPASGATFDSDLTETTASGAKTGTLGKITHISGTVDCGNQTAGTSTVTVSGSTPDGEVSGPFQSYRIQCTDSAQYGNLVSFNAIVTAGRNPTLLIVNLTPNKATVFAEGSDPSTVTSFTSDPATTYSTSATGAHLDVGFNPVVAAGASPPPVSLHLTGDVTCGAFQKSV